MQHRLLCKSLHILAMQDGSSCGGEPWQTRPAVCDKLSLRGKTTERDKLSLGLARMTG